MKVNEIILEAPQVPNFGTAGQSYNVNYNLNTGKAPVKGAAPSTTKFSVGSNGLLANVNGKPTPFSPKDALQKFASGRVAAAKKVSGSLWKSFTGHKLFRFFTNKYLGPFVIWLDDMSSINELFDAGMFNDHGDKAGQVAQQLRTYYTQLLITRMGTMWVAWGTASMATGMAVRALVALIPGIGWLANIAAFAAQAVVYALLNTEAVQKFLTFKILENLAPEWVNDPIYGVARVVGAAGSTVPAYVTQLKKKYLGSDGDKSTAQPSKDTKPAATPAAKPSTPSPSGDVSGADLAKEL